MLLQLFLRRSGEERSERKEGNGRRIRVPWQQNMQDKKKKEEESLRVLLSHCREDECLLDTSAENQTVFAMSGGTVGVK